MVQQLERQTDDGKKSSGERKLFVCHASRNDIVLGYIMMMETMARQAKVRNEENGSSDIDDDDNVPVFRSAMLITGASNSKGPCPLLSFLTSSTDCDCLFD
jgi:hypothetical protein